jgi:hypothetical protein
VKGLSVWHSSSGQTDNIAVTAMGGIWRQVQGNATGVISRAKKYMKFEMVLLEQNTSVIVHLLILSNSSADHY